MLLCCKYKCGWSRQSYLGTRVGEPHKGYEVRERHYATDHPNAPVVEQEPEARSLLLRPAA
jgi:hypothetical protein